MALIHLGTNDVGQGVSSLSNNYEPAISNLATIVGQLRAANPSVKIALAQIVPLAPSDSGYGANAGEVAGFNVRGASLGASLDSAESPVEVVDLYTDFDPLALLFDGVHPNRYGEQLMADRFYVAFQKLMHPSVPVASPEVRIANAGFEDSHLADGGIATKPECKGWTFRSTGSSISGVLNSLTPYYPGSAGLGTPVGAEGACSGFVYNYQPVAHESQLCSIEQTLGAILMPQTLYELTVAVGRSLIVDSSDPVYGGYRLELLAGDALIGFQENAVDPAPGTFVDAGFTVLSDTLDPALFGEPLKIRISATSLANNSGTDFDNVRLTATVVPEPATIVGLVSGVLCGLLVYLHRRRSAQTGRGR